MKKYWYVFGLWGALLIMIGIRHITIPLYNHFFKPIGIEEAKIIETIPERHVYTPEHKGTLGIIITYDTLTQSANGVIYIYPSSQTQRTQVQYWYKSK